MKAKEIVNEATWGDRAKKATNFGIKFTDALMGVSGTKGIDVEKGVAKRNVTELTNQFYKKLTSAVQAWYTNAGSRPMPKDEVSDNLATVIEDTLQVNPLSWELRESFDRLATLVFEEIKDSNSTMASNAILKKEVFQFMVRVSQNIISNRNEKIKSKMVIVNINGPHYFFAFAGELTKWMEYQTVPNSNNEFNKVAVVNDNITMNNIRDNEMKRVAVKDLTGNKQRIQITGEL